MKLGCDFRVEVALALKKVDEILTAFFDQIRVNRAFGIDRDQLSHAAAAEKRNFGQLGSFKIDLHNRARLGVKYHVGKVGVGVIIRMIEADLAGQPTLAGQSPPDGSDGGVNSFGGIGLSRSERSMPQSGRKRPGALDEILCFARIGSLNFDLPDLCAPTQIDMKRDIRNHVYFIE